MCEIICCDFLCNSVEKWTKSKVVDITDTVECAGTIIGTKTVNVWYLLFRLVCAVIITCILLWSLYRWLFVNDFAFWQFFVYITHWGGIINSIYMCSSFVLNLRVYLAVKGDIGDISKYKSIDSLGLRNLWLWTLYFLDIGTSVSFFVILNFCYYIFGARNVYNNQRYIYSPIDWGGNPGIAAGYCIGFLVIIPGFHILIVATKNVIMKAWLKSRTEAEENALVVVGDRSNSKHATSTSQSIEAKV